MPVMLIQMLKLDKNILTGVAITLSGSLIYVLMGVFLKTLNKTLGANYILFLQSFAGLLCASVFVKIKKYHVKQLLVNQNAGHILRATLSLISVYAFIYGLQYVSIFNALVILNLAPLIIPLLRKLFFKKKISFYIFPAILIAFIGVLLLVAPDHHIIEKPVIIILCSMLCMSLSLLVLEGNKTSNPELSIFYYFVYGSLMSGFILFIQHPILNIGMQAHSLGLLIGVLFFLVQLSVVYASQYISSQLISVLFYSEIVMALIVSVVLENMQFNSHLALGTVLVILGGWIVIIIENKSQGRFTI